MPLFATSSFLQQASAGHHRDLSTAKSPLSAASAPGFQAEGTLTAPHCPPGQEQAFWRHTGYGRLLHILFFIFFSPEKKKIGILSLGTRCHSNRASSRLQRQRGWGTSLTQKAAGGARSGACAAALGGSVGIWLWGRVAAGICFPPFWPQGVQSDAPILQKSQPYSSLPSPQSPVPRGCSLGGHAAHVGASKSPPKLCHSATCLCPAVPKPAGFAPGPHPISHLLFNFFRAAYPAKRGTGQSLPLASRCGGALRMKDFLPPRTKEASGW